LILSRNRWPASRAVFLSRWSTWLLESVRQPEITHSHVWAVVEVATESLYTPSALLDGTELLE
jgi:hypothetical protein